MRAGLWVLVFALITPLAAPADDYGSKRDIAAIRHDLPIIENGHYANADAIRDIVVESVVVDGRSALAQFHDAHSVHRQIVELSYTFDRWWVEKWVFVGDMDSPTACPPQLAPTSAFLTNAGVASALVALATDHMPAVREANTLVRQFNDSNPNFQCGLVYLGDPTFSPHTLPFQSTYRRPVDGGVFHVVVKLSPNDGDQEAQIADIRGRAPTQAESWANPPSGNAYFFFSGAVQSEQPVHVQAGTMLDVWFPFVLDPSLRYSLTIAAPNAMSLGPVEGTLKDNTLHFVLPAFTAPPGAELMGEIDSD